MKNLEMCGILGISEISLTKLFHNIFNSQIISFFLLSEQNTNPVLGYMTDLHSYGFYLQPPIFASNFSLITQQDTFPPSARSITWRHVEPSPTGLSSAINMQHSLSLCKLHSLTSIGYTDEFFQTSWVGISRALLLCYLCSHCSPTGLMLPWLISEDFQGFKGSTLIWQLRALKNTLSFFPPLRLVCKHKHQQMCSSSLQCALPCLPQHDTPSHLHRAALPAQSLWFSHVEES